MKRPFLLLHQVLARLPFTLIMLLLLAVFALITGSHNGRLHPAWLQRFGFSAQDLGSWQLDRLLSSAVVTHGGTIFWQAMGMIGLAVGTAEWLTGSKRTATTFWGVHLLTLLAESWLVTPLLKLSTTLSHNTLLIARDVGPSAGYFGCLGLAVGQLPCRWRGWISIAIFIGLGITLFRPATPNEDVALKLFADIAHLIAFPLGYVSTLIFAAGTTL